MINLKRHKFLFIFTIFLILLFILWSVFYFKNTINIVYKNAVKDVTAETEEIALQIDERISSNAITVSTFATTLSAMDFSLTTQDGILLKIVADANDFDFLGITNMDGIMLGADTMIYRVDPEKVFAECLEGRDTISTTILTDSTGSDCVSFSSPIFTDGEVTAVVTAMIHTDTLINEFEDGNLYLIDGDGNIVFNQENTGTTIKGAFRESFAGELINKHIANNINDVFVIEENDSIISFSPLQLTKNWAVILKTPTVNCFSHTNILFSAFFKYLLILAILVIFIFVVFSIRSLMLNQSLRLLAFTDVDTKLYNLNKFRFLYCERLRKKRKLLSSIIYIRVFSRGKKLDVSKGFSKLLLADLREDEIFAICDNGNFILYSSYIIEEKLNARLSKLLDLYDNSTLTMISCGVCEIDSYSFEEALDRARTAAHDINTTDNINLTFYSNELEEKLKRERELLADVTSALSNGEFKASIEFDEYLLYWIHPKYGEIPFEEFYKLAEESSAIYELDLFGLEYICKALKENSTKKISLYQSTLELSNPSYLQSFIRILQKYDVSPEKIELVFGLDDFCTDKILIDLRSLGVKISLKVCQFKI